MRGLHKAFDNVVTVLQNLVDRFKKLVDDLAIVTQCKVDKARGILRELVGGQILLHATADGAERFLTAELSGDYSGLVRLVASPKILLVAVNRNKFCFGQKLRVPLRATQVASKCANAEE